jgi:DNA (cytosine-5)-methyltransferase 1
MRIGSLFSGYGGLDTAVHSVYGGDLAWYSEIEPAACTVLAAHHPDVSNLGDITTVDWSQVEPVDILTGGYPCQPFSHAGQRKGKNDERHLYPYVSAAIRALGPRLVVLENVRGHLSMVLADVIGDLAGLGYDARWGLVSASDAGAPHGRARVFIVAHPHQPGREGADARLDVAEGWRDAGGHAAQGTDGAAADAGSGSLAGAGAAGDGLPVAAERSDVDWHEYAPAIHRWERVLGRPAPAPTVPGVNGRPRLSPRFVEWMMGLPLGHVTGHGLRPAQELKMLGNGVVPQQAALALRMLAVAS